MHVFKSVFGNVVCGAEMSHTSHEKTAVVKGSGKSVPLCVYSEINI